MATLRGKTSGASFSEEQARADIRAVAMNTALKNMFLVTVIINWLELVPDMLLVSIGGSSSFDFAPKQYNKYDSIMKYASEQGYALEDILFVGDDFDDGGGDSHVRIKGMDYIQVENYLDLPELLKWL